MRLTVNIYKAKTLSVNSSMCRNSSTAYNIIVSSAADNSDYSVNLKVHEHDENKNHKRKVYIRNSYC